MTIERQFRLEFSVDRALFIVSLAPTRDSLEWEISVTKDGHDLTHLRQPSWKQPSFGTAGGVAYLWFARSVVLLPTDGSMEVTIIDFDEDIRYFSKLGHHWVGICETSVRVLDGHQPVTRIEMGEVITRASWLDDELVLTDFEGREHTVVTDGVGFSVVDR